MKFTIKIVNMVLTIKTDKTIDELCQYILGNQCNSIDFDKIDQIEYKSSFGTMTLFKTGKILVRGVKNLTNFIDSLKYCFGDSFFEIYRSLRFNNIVLYVSFDKIIDLVKFYQKVIESKIPCLYEPSYIAFNVYCYLDGITAIIGKNYMILTGNVSIPDYINVLNVLSDLIEKI
ncbi:MAG: hypothetical protein QXX12_00755 [Nanopusillaceae archaeon]